MFVAIMCRMRYFGGGLGRMPSVRRSTRLTNPRGFFRPDISVSSACSVPMPPPIPPPPLPPVGTNSWRCASAKRVSASRFWVDADT